MKCCLACLVTLLACCGAAADAHVTADVQKDLMKHPIKSVIQLLDGLLAKIDFEKKIEEDAYGKFEYWCETSTADLTQAISDEKEAIASLTDKIAAKTTEMESLDKQIESLSEKIKANQATAAKAEADRADQHALYLTEKGNLTSTIDAIVLALEAVTGAQTKTHTSLVQKKLRSALVLIQRNAKEEQRNSVAQLSKVANVEDPPTYSVEVPNITFDDVLAKGDEEKHIKKYTFKSGGVIELLKGLEADFREQLLECEQEETNSLNAYDLAKNALDAATAAAEKSKEEKEAEHLAAKKEFDAATSELAATEKDLASDTATLKDTTEACATKKAQWEERSKTREGEVEAMEEAIKILSKVTGVQHKAPENPIPSFAVPPALLQQRAVPNHDKSRGNSKANLRAEAAKRAISLLRKTAQGHNSKLIERLAQEVASHLTAPYDDYVFQPVINMIEKMIFHLQEEQKDEDDHKWWCDKELEKTTSMAKDKKDKLDEVDAELESETSKVAILTEEIAESQERIADIKKMSKEATEIRKIGKKENKKALEDAVDAQDALAKATAVLEEFYKESGEIPKEPWESFVQNNHRDPLALEVPPKTWSSSYTGVMDADKQPSGIISVLETTMAEFARMEETIKTNEETDQHEYEMIMSQFEVETAGRKQEVKDKTREKKVRSDNIADLTKEKKHISKELKMTLQYLTDLQKPCVNADSTYAERKAARDSEIAGLEEAQDILTTAYDKPVATSAFLQVRSKHQFSLNL